MEDQQFILRWHYHETTLLRNLPQLLDAEVLTDITLSADNKVVKAHRIILATCSSYFLQLFQNMGALQHPVIILHNTCYEDLKCLISFIYKGQCLITKNQLPRLLSLAKMLQIQGLCDMKLPQEATTNDNFVHSQNSMTKRHEGDNINIQQTQHQNLIEDLDNFQDINCNKHINYVAIEPEYSKSDLTQHKKGAKDLLYRCFVCGKYLSNQYNLRVHMETHEEGCYVCQSCPHVSRSRDALRKHVSYRHQEQYDNKKRKKADSNG